MKSFPKKLFCASLFTLLAQAAVAEVAVIVHPGNGDAIDKNVIQQMNGTDLSRSSFRMPIVPDVFAGFLSGCL